MITIGRDGSGYARVSLQDHLDHYGTQGLRIQLGAVLDTGVRYVTVDLSDVDLCNENMLDLLCWVERRVAAQQGWLALTGDHHLIRFSTIVDQLPSRIKPSSRLIQARALGGSPRPGRRDDEVW